MKIFYKLGSLFLLSTPLVGIVSCTQETNQQSKQTKMLTDQLKAFSEIEKLPSTKNVEQLKNHLDKAIEGKDEQSKVLGIQLPKMGNNFKWIIEIRSYDEAKNHFSAILTLDNGNISQTKNVAIVTQNDANKILRKVIKKEAQKILKKVIQEEAAKILKNASKEGSKTRNKKRTISTSKLTPKFSLEKKFKKIYAQIFNKIKESDVHYLISVLVKKQEVFKWKNYQLAKSLGFPEGYLDQDFSVIATTKDTTKQYVKSVSVNFLENDQMVKSFAFEINIEQYKELYQFRLHFEKLRQIKSTFSTEKLKTFIENNQAHEITDLSKIGITKNQLPNLNLEYYAIVDANNLITIFARHNGAQAWITKTIVPSS